MAGEMKLGGSEQVESFGLTFLNRVADAFNAVLMEQGVRAPEARQELLGGLMFALAMELDDGSAVAQDGDAEIVPLMCFARRDVESGDVTEIYPPDGSFDYHDYAHSAADGAVNEPPDGPVTTA